MLQNPLKGFYEKSVWGESEWILGLCEQNCFLISKIFCGQIFSVFIIICPKVMGVLILFALRRSDRFWLLDPVYMEWGTPV